jgi:hypothetical protein
MNPPIVATATTAVMNAKPIPGRFLALARSRLSNGRVIISASRKAATGLASDCRHTKVNSDWRVWISRQIGRFFVNTDIEDTWDQLTPPV